MTPAWNLAIDFGHLFKDRLYLALAISRSGPLRTADAKFAVEARGAWQDVCLLEGQAQ